jgi:type IV pilus assembly protein PilA
MVSAKITLSPSVSARRGFSLVEALVVVMVILIIAAIAIPSMLQSRMRANEAAAVASMRTIQTAETLYATEYPEEGYAPSLAVLGPNGSDCSTADSKHSCIIMDDSLLSGLKGGYIFEILGDGTKPTVSYTVTATPQSAAASGRCSFGSNQTGTIFKVPTSGGGGRFAIGSDGTCGN